MHRPVTMKRSMVKRRKRISVAQGYSDDESEDEFRPQLPLKRTIENRVPEIEDYMIKRPSLLSPQENVLPKTPPNHYLFSKFPEKSTECPPPPSVMRENPLRLESLFNPKEDCSMLPSLTLPPLMYQGAPSPPMSQASSQASTQTSPSQTSVTQSSMTQQREYDLADFDAALDKIEHLRRQVRPEQAYALSQLTQSITELASRAEAVLEHY